MSKHVFFFGDGRAEGDPKRTDLLGGKGAGLAAMTAIGLPVPAGFTLSTELCNRLQNSNQSISAAPESKQYILEALSMVEQVQGARFGDPAQPLLVSIRSGACHTMPGMMDTILNLGMNDEIMHGLAAKTQDLRFALDTYRRFIAMYAEIALGVNRTHFDNALEIARAQCATSIGLDIKQFNDAELKQHLPDNKLSADLLQQLVITYKDIVSTETGQQFPLDPHDQLWGAIDAVFNSWKNPRAQIFREINNIPDSWGTACTVQAMVFGNLGETSATGVVFTRNPIDGAKKLSGEWLPNAQGEDVVAGIRTPHPFSSEDACSLELQMPAIYKQFAVIAHKLEKHFREVQDIEFTIQEGKLFILQSRSAKLTGCGSIRTAVEMFKEGIISQTEAMLKINPNDIDPLLHLTLDPKAPKDLLTSGLPASPGIVQGHIAFSAEEAERLTRDGKSAILVRMETSPEDICGMKVAEGIITARGGMTCHAAIVARGMGKSCIVGCSALDINHDTKRLNISIYDIDGLSTKIVTLAQGDMITIDGATGSIYAGIIPTIKLDLSSELNDLLNWADMTRTMEIRANADTPQDAKLARSFGAEGIGLCRTEHMFFAEERITVMREMILATDKTSRQHALNKLLSFQRHDFIDLFREMDGLPVTIRLLDPPLHEFLPKDEAQIKALANTMGISVEKIKQRINDLHESNPMLGHRGCRLAITFPEIYEMQIRAIFEAAQAVIAEGITLLPEIMIPLAISKLELVKMRELVTHVEAAVFADIEAPEFKFGTMIELPRSAILAAELAQVAEFFSFGTNDLTQATMGLSRDDAGKFLPAYVETGILPQDPFVSIDRDGVGALIDLAIREGRKTNPNIKLGICGEHGGDPASIEFLQKFGLSYVSCSPFRIPVARLAAAQAQIKAL